MTGWYERRSEQRQPARLPGSLVVPHGRAETDTVMVEITDVTSTSAGLRTTGELEVCVGDQVVLHLGGGRFYLGTLVRVEGSSLGMHFLHASNPGPDPEIEL